MMSMGTTRMQHTTHLRSSLSIIVIASFTAVSQAMPAILRASKDSNIWGMEECFNAVAPGALAKEIDVRRAIAAAKRYWLNKAAMPMNTKALENVLSSCSLLIVASCWGVLSSPGKEWCGEGRLARGWVEIGEGVTEVESKFEEIKSYLNRSAKSSRGDGRICRRVLDQCRNIYKANKPSAWISRLVDE